MNCSQCDSLVFTLLGQLGRFLHLRCRACGWDTSVLAADYPELASFDDEDDEVLV